MKLTLLLLMCLSQATAQTNSIVRSQDQDLLTNVERFAGSGDESAPAWQYLISHDREKLISDLMRISHALPVQDRNRVLIAFTFCKMRLDYDHNRQVILSALTKSSPYKNFGDWAVTLVGSLVMDGDKDLLKPLFKASAWSDGAMSTELASTYSQALLMDPHSFLRDLSLQPQSIRDRVLDLLRDNSLTPQENQKVKTYLKSVPPSSKLAPLAARILKAVS